MPSESRDATAHPTQRRFEVDGLGIAVRDYSRGTALDGPPILLLHGGMAHARWFDFMGPLLAPLGRPFAMDRRGHGESDWT
ncbi:MAG: alpha/beta hydrolase, partial [Deltaproteobacteria bacterium]